VSGSKCINALNGGDVGRVDKFNYLGIYILKDRFFKMDTSWVIRKFYAAANAVNCHTKSVQELSRLYLLEAFTLPILTYGCDGIFVSCSNIRKMNVYNVYRKVFNMNIWELVECIQLFCGRLDFVHVAVLHKLKFYNGLYRANNSVVKECFCSI